MRHVIATIFSIVLFLICSASDLSADDGPFPRKEEAAVSSNVSLTT
jgi:hypothetical protein